MIDKKPFRVTNEQLEDIMNGENYGIECEEWNDTNIHAIVSDLQDARELIDNQEAIIKEMWEMISSLSSRVFDISLYPETKSVVKEAEKILEKTKGYA